MTDPDRATRAGAIGREAWLTLLLVFSGAAALMHQAAWFRLLRPVLGVGVLQAAVVSAGALLGLAIGSMLGGRLADTRGRPGVVFLAAEAGAALLGFLLVPGLAAWVADGDGGASGDAIRLVGALLACAATALPMGATLPAAVRALAPGRSSVGAVFRRLYGWNTIGAVVGVLVAAGWLLEAEGNLGVVRIASAVQLGVALLALLTLARRRTEIARPRPDDLAPRRLQLAAFLAGGAGLAVQVAWVRRLTPVVGNTTYAFATVLAMYLLALAIGTLLLGPRRGAGPTRGPVVLLIAASVPVALLPAAIGAVGAWTAARIGTEVPDRAMLLGIRTIAAGVLLVPSTVLGAAVLPWLVRAAAPTTQTAGRSSGGLLGMNTAGSALFAVLAGFFWLPAVGSAAVLRGAAGVYLFAAALLGGVRATVLLCAVGALLLLQPLVRPIDDDALFDAMGAAFMPGRYGPADAERTFAEEGQVATVVVRDREGVRELWVDSKIVASVAPTDRLHLALLGHLPMALHPDPRRVAVIGLGTGLTARAVAAWSPEVLDVFELEPAVARAASRFEPDGGGTPPGALVTFGDGRHLIARADERYDVVTSDPIHPGVAGSASLYSLEQYRLLAERATLVCQWLPLYQMTSSDVKLVVRTFALAFRCPYVFLAGPDALLIGTDVPLSIDEATLRERLATAAARDLDTFGLRAPGRLLGLLAQGPDGARRFAGAGALNTDDRLLLEFRCARSWYTRESAQNARYLRIGRTDPTTLLAAAPSAAFEEELGFARQFRKTMRVWLDFDVERTLAELEDLLAADPKSEFARRMRHEALIEMARVEVDDGRAEDARARLLALLEAEDVTDGLRLDAIEVLFAAGARADARAAARAIAAARGWPRAKRLAGGLDTP